LRAGGEPSERKSDCRGKGESDNSAHDVNLARSRSLGQARRTSPQAALVVVPSQRG
jgi:hypothetical protein